MPGRRFLFERIGKAVLGGIAVAVAALLATLTWRQIGAWRDTATVFAHALEVMEAARINPAAADFGALGALAAATGRPQDAVAYYQRALSARPGFVVDRFNYANLLAGQGQDAEAIALRPDYAKARLNLAATLLRLGEREEAIARYREALRLQPGSVEARVGLAGADPAPTR